MSGQRVGRGAVRGCADNDNHLDPPFPSRVERGADVSRHLVRIKANPRSIRPLPEEEQEELTQLGTTGSLPLVLQYARGPQGRRDDLTGIERIVGRLSQQARRLQGSRDNRSRIASTE